MSQTATDVISGMSRLIAEAAASMESENRHPRAGADESDDHIKDMKARIVTLRRLREEFENEMSR